MARKNSDKPQDQQNSSSFAAAGAAPMSTGNGREGMGDESAGADVPLSTDEIAARAYEIYEREGRSDGRDMDHWLKAESELRAERQPKVEPRPEVQQRQPNPQSRQELPRSARQHQPATGV